MDMPAALLPRLSALAVSSGASRLVLFGSRARGDNHPRSDIDLAVWGLTFPQSLHLAGELEELPTLLKFDLVSVGPDTNPELLAAIRKDGVTLYAAES